MELLTAYISADPRAEVRALALQCFLRLIPQAARAGAFGSSEFNVLLAIIEDSNTVPALHILALQVIRKVSCLMCLFAMFPLVDWNYNFIILFTCNIGDCRCLLAITNSQLVTGVC